MRVCRRLGGRSRVVTAAAALALLLASEASAQAAAASTPRDFTGIWQLREDAIRTFSGEPTAEQVPPYNAAFMEVWRTIRDRTSKGMKVYDPGIRCLPPGMPRTMNANYPFELLMTPGRVTLLTEFFNETRRVWMDGRGHPPADELEPTFAGHSIGRWEGDTLVIDTVGLRHETVIDVQRIPHSDQLHIVERVRKIGPDELQWQITLNDKVVFERPWTATKTFIRAPAGTEVREFVCADNNQADPYEPSADDAKYDQPDPRLKTLP